ncbi:MAG: neutral/alkaline non-lysosomal ceramidase N-terminal domain-containing protein [Planctomycetaceae bacterium]
MKTYPGLACLVFAVLSFVAPTWTLAQEVESQPAGPVSGWKAGVAATVITPEKSMWMSGYASRKTPAEGKIHDLWAKAIVIDDPSGNRIVLVTLDLVGIDRGTSTSICRALKEQHDLDRSQIAISTSHTHSGPVVGQNLITMYEFGDDQHQLITDYTNKLIGDVTHLVGKAIASLEPAVIQYGEGHCSLAVNRRNNREADVPKLRENGQLVGPVDHSAPVLAVRHPDGALRAIVFGYACHATVLSLMDWSGDWPGFAQIELEKNHPNAVALFWAGCGADQNPLPRRTVELAQQYGRQIAASVEDVLASPMTNVTGSIKSTYTEIDLALGPLPTKSQVQKDLDDANVYITRRARRLMKTFEADGKLASTYPYPVQLWSIGNGLDMVILGGEVTVEYSLRLKDELPGPTTWVAGYSNDVMAYIPSARVLMEGGYEGATSMIYYGLPTVWSDRVEEHIVRTVHKLKSNSGRE